MLASLAQTTAAVKIVAVRGRALEIRLDQVEEQSSRTNVQLDAMAMISRAHNPRPRRYTLLGPAHLHHSVKLHMRAPRLCLNLLEAYLEGPAFYRHPHFRQQRLFEPGWQALRHFPPSMERFLHRSHITHSKEKQEPRRRNLLLV